MRIESVALRVPNAHDDEMLHAFIWGLRDRIKQEVRFRNPTTLIEAARIALEVEETFKF